MPVDTAVLVRFYDSPRGQVARRYIARRLKFHLAHLSGQNVLGVGYVTPYLRAFLSEAARVVAAEPSLGPPTCWPKEARGLCASRC